MSRDEFTLEVFLGRHWCDRGPPHYNEGSGGWCSRSLMNGEDNNRVKK